MSFVQKSKTALFWSSVDILLRFGFAFGFTVAMSRLLSPEEYGTFALLSLFVGIASCFAEAGFSSAIIQCREVSEIDKSSVFYFNVVMSIVVATLLAVSAPLIASFYANSPLTGLLYGLAINLFIGSLASVQTALYTKELNFQPVMYANLSGTLFGGIVGVTCAIQGFGVWSILFQTLTTTTVSTALLWHLSPWRPTLEFSTSSLMKFFRFGGYLFASGLIDITYNRAYTLLMGKLFGIQPLGLYNRADQLQQMPSQIVSSILGRVTFPVYSSLKSDKFLLSRGVAGSIQAAMLVNVPIMMGLAATAEDTLVFVFGHQWSGAAPFLKLLCVAGLFYPLHVINLDVLKAQGHSNLFFRLEMIKKTIGLLLLLIGCLFGLFGIAYARVIASFISFAINAYYTGKFLDTGILPQCILITPTIGCGVAMYFFVIYLDCGIGHLITYILPIQILSSIVFWTVAITLLNELGGLRAVKNFSPFKAPI